LSAPLPGTTWNEFYRTCRPPQGLWGTWPPDSTDPPDGRRHQGMGSTKTTAVLRDTAPAHSRKTHVNFSSSGFRNNFRRVRFSAPQASQVCHVRGSIHSSGHGHSRSSQRTPISQRCATCPSEAGDDKRGDREMGRPPPAQERPINRSLRRRPARPRRPCLPEFHSTGSCTAAPSSTSPATATGYEPTKPPTDNTPLQSSHPKVRNSADQLWGISLIAVRRGRPLGWRR